MSRRLLAAWAITIALGGVAITLRVQELAHTPASQPVNLEAAR